jgi:hypothetical protein
MLTGHLQIDFNKVGLATNLKAPAARMRYSRLKKNIEDKLGEGSKKAPVSSAGSTGAADVTSAIGSNKKRKASYEDENEQMELASFGNKIGNATISIKPQEDTIGPRTRGKRIDLTAAFKNDSDSSSGPGLGDQDDAGDDDYEMEDISDDEADFHPDETTEDEDNQPVSRSKSRGQSAKRKTITAKSTFMAFKKSSKAIPRSVPDTNARETTSGPGMPVTPEPAVSSRHEINGKNFTLPPTPISMPTGVIKQEPADSSPTIPKARSDTTELSAAVRSKKTSHTSAKLSLFDRIENARIRADHNLASLSYNVNKNSRSPGPSQWITSETVLPSIEHDAEEANVDSAIVHTSSRAHSKTNMPRFYSAWKFLLIANANFDSLDL